MPGIGDRKLTQALGVFGIFSHLYFPPSDWVVLEYGLEAALQGDGSVLLDMVDDRTDRNPDGTFSSNSNEAFYAVSCLDRPGVGGVDHAARAGGRAGPRTRRPSAPPWRGGRCPVGSGR